MWIYTVYGYRFVPATPLATPFVAPVGFYPAGPPLGLYHW